MVNENWLEQQRSYQEGVYGVDYPAMWRDHTVVDYVTTMLTAAQIEVAEAFQEVPWKPWTQLTPEQRTERLGDQRAKVVGELVDVLFFVANTLIAVGCTDERLAEMYAAKMGVNKQRQASGYDGVSTKCASCGRALDEPGAAQPIKGRSGRSYCSYICGAAEDDVTIRKGERFETAAACGHLVGPFALYAIGLDGKFYCGTQCAVQYSGGQRDLEDVAE